MFSAGSLESNLVRYHVRVADLRKYGRYGKVIINKKYLRDKLEGGVFKFGGVT
jgi:hypothetical protein